MVILRRLLRFREGVKNGSGHTKKNSRTAGIGACVHKPIRKGVSLPK